MFVGDLINELKKYPELSVVFIDFEGERGIDRVADTAEVWVQSVNGFGSIHGPYVEVESEAHDYGVLLV